MMGLGYLILKVDEPGQFPFLRRYHGDNLLTPNRYRKAKFRENDWTSLIEAQVTWSPWAGVEDFRGYARALDLSRTRRLFRHEYGLIFYLGERVIRQHTPSSWPLIPHFPPVSMRFPWEISKEEKEELLSMGVNFIHVSRAGNYADFAERYLMRETRGVLAQVFYDRYKVLGGDPRFIQGQSRLARDALGYASPPSGEDVGVHDSDVDGLSVERDRDLVEDAVPISAGVPVGGSSQMGAVGNEQAEGEKREGVSTAPRVHPISPSSGFPLAQVYIPLQVVPIQAGDLRVVYPLFLTSQDPIAGNVQRGSRSTPIRPRLELGTHHNNGISHHLQLVLVQHSSRVPSTEGSETARRTRRPRATQEGVGEHSPAEKRSHVD